MANQSQAEKESAKKAADMDAARRAAAQGPNAAGMGAMVDVGQVTEPMDPPAVADAIDAQRDAAIAEAKAAADAAKAAHDEAAKSAKGNAAEMTDPRFGTAKVGTEFDPATGLTTETYTGTSSRTNTGSNSGTGTGGSTGSNSGTSSKQP